MTNPADPKVADHAGLAIKLETTTGKFYCPLGDHVSFDKTLDGLKGKIDNWMRITARNAAAKLPAVLMRRADRWGDDNKTTWIEGTFAGMNAHTGELTVIAKNGQRIELRYAGWLFPADSPHLPRIRKLAETRDETARIAKAAEKELDAALEDYGYQPHVGRGTNAAAETEAEIVRFLSGDQVKGKK